MRIYLVRHGESEAIDKNIRQSPETPLSKLGIKQANVTAELLKEQEIEVILSSPWKRAWETAEIINKLLNKKLIKSDLLREKDQNPKIYGKNNNDPLAIEYEMEFKKNWTNFNWKFRNKGESINNLFERAKNLEKLLLEKYRKNSLVLVSHGHFLKCLVCYLISKNEFKSETFIKFYNSFSFRNAGITVIRYDEEKQIWRLESFSPINSLLK